MKELVLENLVHRGTVSAEGFLFSAKILSESEIRRRIISVWQNSAKLYRYKEFYILIFADSFQIDCRTATGLPLVRYKNVLSAFPLQSNQVKVFQGEESLIFLNEGKIQKLSKDVWEAEDLADWFDVSHFNLIETKSLGEIVAKPVSVKEIKEVNLREDLQGIPKADNQLNEILSILKQKQAEFEKQQKYGAGYGASQFSAGGFSQNSSVSELFGTLFNSLKNVFGAKYSEGFSQQTPQSPGNLKKFFANLAFKMKLTHLVGRKQAEYLLKMMEMFESGDLDEALKYAIPLENMRQIKAMTESMPFLGFLKPRPNLQINFGSQGSSGSAVHLDTSWFDDLRQIYRRSFERLEAQNRIEEAAFVLAELLQNHHEAVEFLEKHGKYEVAARLAESRDLPKDVVIRLLFLAGEKHKAVQLAVLHNSFEYVVTKLEQQNHPAAKEVREIWAQKLAQGGNYQAAVNVIWQLADRREIAGEWIEKTIEFGGAAAARMLVKKILLMPEKFSEVKEKLEKIIDSSGSEERENRRAFAEEVLKSSVNEELAVLLRPLSRKLLIDAQEDHSDFTQKNFRRIVELSKDYSLRTDLPKLPVSPQKKDFEPLEIKIAENDKGSFEIYDACLLPNDRIAVALGEAGVKILSKTGKTLVHFDQPTEKFILSDSGTRAICLAKRDEIYRLAKIDFLQRKATYWCDAAISHFAPSFDGNIWFIGLKDEIYAIDANAEKFESVWQVSELGGQVFEISRSPNKLMLLIMNGRGIEKWWYDLPGFYLRSRNEPKWLQMENENQILQALSSYIAYAVVQIDEQLEDRINFIAKVYDYDTQIAKFNFSEETHQLYKPQVIENKYVISQMTDKENIFTLYETPNTKIAEFSLPKSRVSAKLSENYLTLTDEYGRLIIFDHKGKNLLKNIRL